MPTVFFGQQKSDSSTFSIEEVNYFIEQCFSAKEYAKSLDLCDTINDALINTIGAQNNVIDEKQHQIELEKQKVLNSKNDCASDKKKLQDQVDVLTKKNKWYKVGSFVGTPFAIFGAGKLFFDYVIKK